jgi:hypothetical protein
MIKKLLNKWTGITLVEICVVTGIYSLFILTFYATMDVGLKSWKMGEVKADMKTTAACVLKRITDEIEKSDDVTITAYSPVDPDKDSYICFETPVYRGEIQYASGKGSLLWQGHILYYTLDENKKEGNLKTKILYRRYIPHNKTSPYKSDNRLFPTLLSYIKNYTDDRILTEEDCKEGQTLRRLCNKISTATFKELYGNVNIELTFKENLRNSTDAKVSIESMGNNSLCTETYFIKASVKAKN